MAKQDYDCIIVGAGAVGLTTALMLGTRGFHVALVDRTSREQIYSPTHDTRAFAFAYGTKRILEKYDLFDALAPHAHPIEDIIVSSDDTARCLSYASGDVATHPMGYNVETAPYRQLLLDRLANCENVRFFDETSVTQVDNTPHRVTVRLERQTDDTNSLTTKLLVAADGKNSAIRQALGITSRTLDYGQHAYVTTMVSDRPVQNNRAIEHFTPEGPLAALPLGFYAGKARYGVIWSVKDKLCPQDPVMRDAQLTHLLNKNFSRHYGALTLCGSPKSYPVSALVAGDTVAGRVILIGDAAHAIHPVAGQGFNLGVRDGAHLADMLQESRSLGLDLGDPARLRAYARSRRADQLSMTAMCHGLVRLFSNHSRLLGLLRGQGLGLVEHLTPLKKSLTRHAMGL